MGVGNPRGWSRRAQLAALVAVLVAAGLAVGLLLGLRGGRQAAARPAVHSLTHLEYARLYRSAVIGTTGIDVLAKWPVPPYQRYHDGTGALCYEWFDKPVALYNLCFKKNVLVDKAIE